ncbi:26S proteasome non-ATPase regulatory subunit 1-like [Dermatophagoides farinae]|uniref:26S proteasome non-ATPase regulatory subunit 1-like n=1 Tax=Dermatophagoides farinae TaxID=6954 RepID=UPI003F615478
MNELISYYNSEGSTDFSRFEKEGYYMIMLALRTRDCSQIWNKYSVVASLGIINQTHSDIGIKVLSSNLPNQPGWKVGQPYDDAGGLYGLGLLQADKPADDIKKYLREQLSAAIDTMSGNTNNELLTGASMGCSLAFIATNDVDITNLLEAILLYDVPLPSEAACLGMGIVNYSKFDTALIKKLLAFSSHTQHEKILRSIGVAISMLVAHSNENCLEVVNEMISHENEFIRMGGVLSLGTAYFQNTNNDIIARLLKLIIGDASDEMKHMAVMALCFVYLGTSEFVNALETFKMLIDSFNYRIRYAAASAIGLIAAGTGDRNALELLLLVINDSHELVRQAALISLGMIYMGISDRMILYQRKENTPTIDIGDISVTKLPIYPTPTEVRDLLVTLACNSYDDVMVRVGALYGLGFLTASGSNATLATVRRVIEKNNETNPGMKGLLESQKWVGSFISPVRAIGFILYTQFWYWYPFILNITLSFVPQALIAVTEDGMAPEDFNLRLNFFLKLFDYLIKYFVST